jgi:hypothetical protein
VTNRVIKREPIPAWREPTERIGGRVQLKEQGAGGGVTGGDGGMKIMQSVFNEAMREAVRCRRTDARAMPKKSEGGIC